MDKIKKFNQIFIFIMLLIAIISFGYNFYIDKIYCGTPLLIEKVACDMVNNVNEMLQKDGETGEFTAEDEKRCFCAYR